MQRVSHSRQRFGLSVALATPFRQTGEIDLESMTGHASFCLEGGCDSVTLFGTTGEGASIGHAERRAVIAAMAAAGITGDRLVVGISSTAVDDVAGDLGIAHATGCRAILLPPPFYFKNLTDDGIFDWFGSVFGRAGENARNIILYHIPSVTGVALSVDLIARLRTAFPGVIIGVKDSTGDWSYTEPLLAAHRDMAVLIGDERHLAAAVRLGGEGAICGFANLHPGEMRAMAWQGTDNETINDLVELIVDHPVVPAIKALMAHAHGHVAGQVAGKAAGQVEWAHVRAPLTALNGQQRSALGLGFDRLISSGRAA